mmetsp:Transcript_11200/g.12782  ORF Transcript_11200/g.12782 Transcript_11200/m.12782 type:complete len:196 (-) Transcript_11200:281-868(-)
MERRIFCMQFFFDRQLTNKLCTRHECKHSSTLTIFNFLHYSKLFPPPIQQEIYLIMTSFDMTFTNNTDKNNSSLHKKIVVGGALALLLGVATYSSNGATKSDSIFYKNLLRSNQDTCPYFDVSGLPNLDKFCTCAVENCQSLIDKCGAYEGCTKNAGKLFDCIEGDGLNLECVGRLPLRGHGLALGFCLKTNCGV